MIKAAFPTNVYAQRRKLLAKNLNPNTDLVIFFNAPEVVRNNDNHFPFRADSSFVYLCGFHEPHSALMIWKEKKKSIERIHFQLFCQKKDPHKELWSGKITGPAKAKTLFGADEAHPIESLEAEFRKFLSQVPRGRSATLWTNAREYNLNHSKLEQLIDDLPINYRIGQMPLAGVKDAGNKVRELRLIKDSHEIKLMRQASNINVEAHLSLMKKLKPGMREYQIQAIIEFEFLNRGAQSPAYGSICAAGANATCLHYTPADHLLKEGDLLLVDAGCEFHHYASDITRTLPIGGKYSKAQRNIMDVVATAHQDAIGKARSGTPWPKIHEAASLALIDGLRTLKLLKGQTKKIYEKGTHRRYFPHGTGHWLGLDVHDPCPVIDQNAKDIRLKPGMVFTVEPGLYFQAHDNTVPKEYRGIGVRIEDDILVTNSKPLILTSGLPRYAEEIEKFMR